MRRASGRGQSVEGARAADVTDQPRTGLCEREQASAMASSGTQRGQRPPVDRSSRRATRTSIPTSAAVRWWLSARLGRVRRLTRPGCGARQGSTCGSRRRDEAIDGAGAVLLCVPDDAIARPAPHRRGRSGLVGQSRRRAPSTLLAAAESTAHRLSLHPCRPSPMARPPSRDTGRDRRLRRSAISYARSLAESLGMRPFEVPEESRAPTTPLPRWPPICWSRSRSRPRSWSSGWNRGCSRAARPAGPAHGKLGRERPAALTGPIARGDHATVERHREALAEAAPELLPLYDALAARAESVARESVNEAPHEDRPHQGRAARGASVPRRRREADRLVPTMATSMRDTCLMRQAREAATSSWSACSSIPRSSPGRGSRRLIRRDRGSRRRSLPPSRRRPALDARPRRDLSGGIRDDRRGREPRPVVLEGTQIIVAPPTSAGVTTVVAKLFKLGPAEIAYFRRKDAQQASGVGG